MKLSWILAAGFALSLASVACGDDDTTGGSAGSTAGKTGSSGKGGTGGKSGSGASGKGGTAAPAPTMAECISKTNTSTGNTLDATCVSCACTAPADATSLVACDSNCWALIACVTKKCPAKMGMTDTACIVMADAMGGCATELGATGNTGATATPVGAVLQGASCKAKCEKATPPGDAGTSDAGN